MTDVIPNTENNYGKYYLIGITLNIIYVGVEVFYGLHINSSALLADAGHNASDVISLFISWGAICLAKLQPFGKFTYGLRKTTILASSINGVLIIGAAVFILKEAIIKIKNPVAIPGNILMIVAGIGIIINTITALCFIKGQKRDLNIKGTFLHMAADAAVSAAVLVGGVFILNTGVYWIDSLLSFLIVVVILWSAFGLLSDSFKLSVDAVPKDIDLEKVKLFFRELEGVTDVHDLHIWAISTTETALTVHLVIPKGCNNEFIDKTREKLQQKFNIGLSTLQIESYNKKYEREEILNSKIIDLKVREE